MVALLTELPCPLALFTVTPVEMFFQHKVAFAVDLADDVDHELPGEGTFSILDYPPASGVSIEIVE
jgi:hypothetical protein